MHLMNTVHGQFGSICALSVQCRAVPPWSRQGLALVGTSAQYRGGFSQHLLAAAGDPVTVLSPPHRTCTMLGSGFKAERLRVNLRLVINRLKLLEKKKSE